MRKLLLAHTGLTAAGIILMDAGNSEAKIAEMQERLQALLDEGHALVAKADEEQRDLSDDETEKLEANQAEAERLSKQIQARQALVKPLASAGRRTAADPAVRPGAAVEPRPKANDPRGGFKSFGEFAQRVRVAGAGGGLDNRLQAAATTFGSEGTGADGGFAVPPEFRTAIWQKVMGEDGLIGRTDQMTVGGNSLTVPKDDSTPWQSSGGVLAFWEGEGNAITASKPALGQETIRLNKLTALVNVTDELLEDAPALESWLRAKAPAKMQAKLNTAIVAGTGVGMPLGILNSPGLVSVAKETSQAADTIYYANIVKMWSRMYGELRSRAIWLINQDIEPQLMQLQFVQGATSPVPAYLPANGLAGQPYGTLLGRPVVPVQACKTIGDKGDIIFACMDQYMTATKGGGIRTDSSIHLYFDQSITAFRFIFRVAGQPWWSSAVTPENGGNTLGAFVTLDDRT